MSTVIKKYAFQIIPWLITVAALYFAFRGVDWEDLWQHVVLANKLLLLAAVVLTMLSYLLRARRWQFLFPPPAPGTQAISYLNSFRVLILGFFMNNILPARTGELVRAHMGSAVTNNKRTLVLATIAGERLADGLMLSGLFVVFALSAAHGQISQNLLLVALVFVLIGFAVVATIACQKHVLRILSKFNAKVDHQAASYATTRIEIFINGLKPLATPRILPLLTVWSLIIWLVELAVYVAIAHSFGAEMPLSYCVLFLVAVNFSSLIPAAPGGIGVIEAVASSVLISVGISKEQALSMVLVQHVIQYVVVGVPGAIVLLNRGNVTLASSEVAANSQSA